MVEIKKGGGIKQMGCRICGTKGDTKHIDLYITGSEGLQVCRLCEMAIIDMIRIMMLVAAKARIATRKAIKEEEK